MLSPGKLKKAFEKVEDDNWKFRTFLKRKEPEDLDEFVNKLHRTLFREMDCRVCRNCCKTIVPVLTHEDIERISNALGLTIEEFRNEHLKESEGEWIVNSKPCQFLTPDGCSIYESRPKACREYPYTDKKEIIFSLLNLYGNCEICPVVFEIFERLKKKYRR